MSVVTKDYVDSLPEIYQDILAAFPEIEPARNAGEGLAYQTLFAKLREQGEKGESLPGDGEVDSGPSERSSRRVRRWSRPGPCRSSKGFSCAQRRLARR